MSSHSAQLRTRRVVWILPLTLLAWTACGGSSGPDSADAGSQAGALAGNAPDGGRSGCGPTASCGGLQEPAGGSVMAHGGDRGDSGHENAGSGGIQEISGAAGSDATAISGAAGATDAFVPAPHSPFPLVTAHGGPVLENIELVPVYFNEDPLFAELEQFNAWIVTSNYWKQAGSEYGVEAGTHLSGIKLASAVPATISDAQVASWIDTWVANQTLPTPNANTVFVFFFQAGTTITNRTGASCRAFAGLHETAAISNPIFTGEVPFVIVPRCTYSADDDPLMIATNVASHEYIETATDPFNLTNPGWVMDNDSGPLEAWGMLSGPAVADLCLNQSYDVVEGFTVQDIWSNAAAQAGLNPCQPSDPKRPYFSVSAEQTIYHAQPGTSLTVTARAWSNLPTADWEVAVNWGIVPYGDFDGHAVLSQAVVNNGAELTASVTVPIDPPATDGRSQYRFTIDSIDPINPNFAHSWPVLIVVP